MEKEEILKELEYMHHHNEHHNEELQEIADNAGGKTKELIEEAIKKISEGNDVLLEAIKAFKE